MKPMSGKEGHVNKTQTKHHFPRLTLFFIAMVFYMNGLHPAFATKVISILYYAYSELKPSELKELFQLHMGAGAERLCASCYHHHCLPVWSGQECDHLRRQWMIPRVLMTS